MTSRAEAYIEDKVCDWAKARGILAVKFTPSGDIGWPDHIFVVPPLGTIVWLEFKAPGKKPKPMQAYRIEKIQEAGGNAHWTDSVAGGIEILTSYMETKAQ